MSIVDNARKIAEKAHAGQLRKWGSQEPFFKHPERIANKVASLEGMKEADIAAAYLHDVLEDCGEHWAAVIEQDCGKETLELVRELTYPTEGPEWQHRSRAEKNVIRMEHTRRMTDRAKRLKMCDRIDNLNTMQNAPFKLIQKYVVESNELLGVLGHVDEKLAKELKEAVEHLKKVAGR